MLLYCQHNAFVLITHACLTSAGIVPSSFTVLSIFMCAVKWELLGWLKHVVYSRFRVFSPECTLHTAITHVIKVLVRWSLM